MRATLALISFILLGALTLLWLRARDNSPSAALPPGESAAPIITKLPPTVSTRRFDPAHPPADMPPLHAGEQAQCDSNFGSTAVVSSQTRRTSSTSAVVAITQVKMTLQLGITIWVPDGVTQKVLEHEEGHRQISESYYATAEKLAQHVSAPYMGKQFEITGNDLDAQANRWLQQISGEITAEYTRQLDPASAQLRYDEITDHARNDVLAQDAVAQVLGKIDAGQKF